MNIAVVGSGGREHALAWKLSQSPLTHRVLVLPGNGGTSDNLSVSTEDFRGLEAMCREYGIELLVVGPEAPLVQGIWDHFRGSGIRVFGPSAAAAQLEGSKIFAKEFMQRHGVATAGFRRFDAAHEAREFVKEQHGNVVIKYDGLAAGKGVFVTSTVEEALEALEEVRRVYGENAPLLVEEKLVGQEISILGITDGNDLQLLTPSQDHKQRFEGDQGPMTGGMGAFCPVPHCDDKLLKRIVDDVVKPTMAGIQADQMDYVGVIYFGLMITRNGPKLLEYNVRLGDPETEVVLPKLKSDLVSLILSCFDGTLKDQQLEFNPGYYVDVVLASDGYPGTYPKGVPIEGLEHVPAGGLVFHAGTNLVGGKLVTTGGRVLNVVGQGETLEEAIADAYGLVEKISFSSRVYRTDIGRREWRL
jgi:phosphoribosylamine--glycine ligase